MHNCQTLRYSNHIYPVLNKKHILLPLFESSLMQQRNICYIYEACMHVFMAQMSAQQGKVDI